MSIYDWAEKRGMDRKTLGLTLWLAKWIVIIVAGISLIIRWVT